MITIDNVDIFLLSYNREKYIIDMIRSLRNQSIGDFEIKILDNGSSDNTEKIINDLNDRNITFLGSGKNNGALWNFQRAQKLATKKYTILLHDDDLLHPNYLEYAVQLINENDNIDLICSGMIATTNPNQNNFKSYKYNPIIFNRLENFASLIYLGFPLNFATAIYRTENLKNIKIDIERYGKIADRPMLYDSVVNGKIALFGGQYIQYRLHASQDSSNSKTGPFYNETIALHKKYKEIVFKGNAIIPKVFFLVNFYRYVREEYNRFNEINMSFDEYLKLALKEISINRFELIMSKIFYFSKAYLLYKLYRLIKRNFGEYS